MSDVNAARRRAQQPVKMTDRELYDAILAAFPVSPARLMRALRTYSEPSLILPEDVDLSAVPEHVRPLAELARDHGLIVYDPKESDG